jgi:hypothetical protein
MEHLEQPSNGAASRCSRYLEQTTNTWNMKKNLREDMPETAAWIDALRAAFGADHINGQIRAGMAGQPVFDAAENGHTVGTPRPERGTVVSGADLVLPLPDRATEKGGHHAK